MSFRSQQNIYRAGCADEITDAHLRRDNRKAAPEIR
jgi:hypothetical protein